jgi:hypothetical protein
MPLAGLRAWIGEVERKLGMRTRVFLALVAIAIGGAGTGIYLALDARDSAVSESDVQELQQQLEDQIEAGGAAGLSTLEAEVKALQSQVEGLRGKGGGKGKGGGSSGTGTGGTQGGGASAGGADEEKLRELLERAKRQAEKSE